MNPPKVVAPVNSKDNPGDEQDPTTNKDTEMGISSCIMVPHCLRFGIRFGF